MGSKAPSWSDQWGNGGFGSGHYDEEDEKVKKSSGSSKMAAGVDKAKSVAIVGADKAKTAAVVGAQKVKSGTSAGIKWMKNQYQKRTSK